MSPAGVDERARRGLRSQFANGGRWTLAGCLIASRNVTTLANLRSSFQQKARTDVRRN